MNQNKVAIGGFSDDWYLTSSEQGSADWAWKQNFGSIGGQGSASRAEAFKVRPVRAF